MFQCGGCKILNLKINETIQEYKCNPESRATSTSKERMMQHEIEIYFNKSRMNSKESTDPLTKFWAHFKHELSLEALKESKKAICFMNILTQRSTQWS
jgi:hypothetical protein